MCKAYRAFKTLFGAAFWGAFVGLCFSAIAFPDVTVAVLSAVEKICGVTAFLSVLVMLEATDNMYRHNKVFFCYSWWNALSHEPGIESYK